MSAVMAHLTARSDKFIGVMGFSIAPEFTIGNIHDCVENGIFSRRE